MKSNKGFTLVELLAVIVILAIIALIATPIILNVIDTARQGSAKSAAAGYVDAVEKAVMLAQFDDAASEEAKNILSSTTSKTYHVVAGGLAETSGGTKVLSVEVNGEAPAVGGTVTIEKGAVKAATLTFAEIYGDAVGYDGTTYSITTSSSSAASSSEAA